MYVTCAPYADTVPYTFTFEYAVTTLHPITGPVNNDVPFRTVRFPDVSIAFDSANAPVKVDLPKTSRLDVMNVALHM